MAEYRFSTIWRVDAPLVAVWDAIYQVDRWPVWWKGAVRTVEIEPGDVRGVGALHFVVLVQHAGELVEAGEIGLGVGGGLVRPMQQRWEGYLTKAEEEAPKIKAHAAGAPSVSDQARDAAARVQDTGTHRI